MPIIQPGSKIGLVYGQMNEPPGDDLRAPGRDDGAQP
jgi:F0F1-type ATP synthase beta subunit